MNISGSRRIRCKEREMPKSSLLKGEIFGLTGTTIINPRKTSPKPSQANAQVVSSVFKEPVYWILEKIKNEPYFKWPNKMGGDASKCN